MANSRSDIGLASPDAERFLRVLIDRGNAPSHSGIGIYSSGLLDALQRYGAPAVSAKEWEFGGAERSRRSFHRVRYFYHLGRLRKCNFGEVSGVHFTNVYVPHRHPRVKYVATIHDIDPLLYPATSTIWYQQYYRWVVHTALSRADIILTVSEAVRTIICERYQLAEDRVTAIYNGLSPDFVTAVDQRAHTFEPGLPYALFVGGLCKKKNTAWLVRWFARGVRTGALPGLHLILAGNPGYGFPEVEQELRNSGQIVRWVRDPDLTQLVDLYLGATVIVLPSLAEGFGIPLIEAMYCGKAIVASRIPSSVEVAERTAHFFSLDDPDSFFQAVRESLDDASDGARKSIIQDELKRFMWKNLVHRYINEYKRILS